VTKMLSYIAIGLTLGVWAGLSPGPLFAVLVSQSVRYGTKEGIKVALVPLITDPPIILVTMLVLTRVGHYRHVLGVLSAIGGLYVGYMAYEALCSDAAGAPKTAATKTFSRAITVNLLSPHPKLFWLTAGGPLILKAWALGAAVPAVFIACFYACMVGSTLAVALVIGRTRHMITGAAYTYTMRALGGLLAVFAVLLVWWAYGLLK